jgi:hypothetical protein
MVVTKHQVLNFCVPKKLPKVTGVHELNTVLLHKDVIQKFMSQ